MCVCCHFLLQALFEEGEAVKLDPRVETVNCTFSAKCCSVVCGVVSAKLIVVDSWPWLIPDSFHVYNFRQRQVWPVSARFQTRWTTFSYGVIILSYS